MATNYFDISIDEREFHNALKAIERGKNSLDARYLKSVQRRKLKPMANAMKAKAPGDRIPEMISITTAKKRSGPLGARVGVVKNDADLFPDFSAQALAAINEYGTAERYRNLKSLGFIAGRQSTGKMPAAPFLRPAWDAYVSQFMKDVQDAIEKKIIKEFEFKAAA